MANRVAGHLGLWKKKTHTSRPSSHPSVYGIISVQPPTLLKHVRPTLSLLSSSVVVEYESRFLPFTEPGCQTHLPPPPFFPNSATSLRGWAISPSNEFFVDFPSRCVLPTVFPRDSLFFPLTSSLTLPKNPDRWPFCSPPPLHSQR